MTRKVMKKVRKVIRNWKLGAILGLILAMSLSSVPVQVSISQEGFLAIGSSVALAVNNPPGGSTIETGGDWIPYTIDFAPVTDGFVAESDEFSAVLPEDVKSGDGMTFYCQGYWFRYEVSGGKMQWSYSEGTKAIGSVLSSQGFVDGNEVIYEDAFWNTDVVYTAYSYGIKEHFVLSALPFGVDSTKWEDIYLEYTGKLDWDSRLSVWVDGVEKPDKTFQTSGRVDFKDSLGEIVFYLPEPRAWDSGNITCDLEYDVKVSKDKIEYALRVPYRFLEAAVFPVYIDPWVASKLGLAAISDIPAYGVVELSGCGYFKGRVKVRFDMYMTPDAPYYDKYRVEVVDETSGEYQAGYPGGMDEETGEPISWEDYSEWWDSLPKVWVSNPFHSHFVYFDTDATDEEIKLKLVETTEYFYTFHKYCWDNERDFIEEWKKVPKQLGTVRDVFAVGVEKESDCNVKVNEIRAYKDKFDTRGSKGGAKSPQDLNIGEKGTIDIGSPAVNRETGISIDDYTFVAKENPANATGTIDTAEIWLSVSIDPDVWVGTFSASGNVMTCRDSENLGAVPAGSKQQYTGLDVDVVAGDYWGTHCKVSRANIERDNSGEGYWYYSGECIDASDSQTFTFVDERTISLYGTGTEAAGDPDIGTVPTSKDFGNVSESSTYWSGGSEPSWPLADGDAYFTISNSGVACSIDVRATNFTGGEGWTLTSGSPGSGEVRLTMFVEGDGSGDGLVLTTSDQELIANLAESGDVDLELKLETGTFTDGVEKSTTITFTATAL